MYILQVPDIHATLTVTQFVNLSHGHTYVMPGHASC